MDRNCTGLEGEGGVGWWSLVQVLVPQGIVGNDCVDDMLMGDEELRNEERNGKEWGGIKDGEGEGVFLMVLDGCLSFSRARSDL